MKTLNALFASHPLTAKFGACLATTATVGMLVLGAAGLLTPANADSRHDRDHRREFEELKELLQKAQVAELNQLAADFHAALSYGGNITAMMSLWAENSSLTFNGVANNGNAAVQAFFTSGGYFHNNWVSLAPEYKTQVTLHGNTAHISTQCVAVDLGVTPNVVKAVIQVEADVVRHEGKWLFTSMNNSSPAPL